MSSVTITRAPRRGLIAFATSTDHKVLAARLFVMAFGWFALAGILALLMRTQLATPQGNLFGHMGYNQLFTMHGSTMIYLFAMPMVLALGAGAADRILVSVGFGYEGQVWFFRVAAFVVPFIVFLITKRVCEELRATETHPLRSFAGGAVRRTGTGGFEEISPAELADEPEQSPTPAADRL